MRLGAPSLAAAECLGRGRDCHPHGPQRAQLSREPGVQDGAPQLGLGETRVSWGRQECRATAAPFHAPLAVGVRVRSPEALSRLHSGSRVCAPDAPHRLGRPSSGCLPTNVRDPVLRLVNFLVFAACHLCAPRRPRTLRPLPGLPPRSPLPAAPSVVLGNAFPGMVRGRTAGKERSGEVRACHLLVSVKTSCKRGMQRVSSQTASRGRESAVFGRDLYSFHVYCRTSARCQACSGRAM